MVAAVLLLFFVVIVIGCVCGCKKQLKKKKQRVRPSDKPPTQPTTGAVQLAYFLFPDFNFMCFVIDSSGSKKMAESSNLPPGYPIEGGG